MINGKIFCESDPWIVGTAHIVCGAGSVQLSGIRLSVCPSLHLSHCNSEGAAFTQFGQCTIYSQRTWLNADLLLFVLCCMHNQRYPLVIVWFYLL